MEEDVDIMMIDIDMMFTEMVKPFNYKSKEKKFYNLLTFIVQVIRHISHKFVTNKLKQVAVCYKHQEQH